MGLFNIKPGSKKTPPPNIKMNPSYVGKVIPVVMG